MAMKGYSTFLNSTIKWFCVISRTLIGGGYPSAEMQSANSTALAVKSATQVQILNEADSVSLCTNTLGKGMNPSVLFQPWVNSRGNQSRRRKTKFKHSFTLLKNWPLVTSCLFIVYKEYLTDYLIFISKNENAKILNKSKLNMPDIERELMSFSKVLIF